MPDHAKIYAEMAITYDRMISKQPDLTSVLENIRPFSGLDVIDLGAGTGRLTCLLAPVARSVLVLDQSRAMLDVAAAKLRQAGLTNWKTLVADHQNIPAESSSADLVVAGWTLCYSVHSHVPGHKENLARILREIERVLKPGGTVIIFETMGTGTDKPQPPSFLTEYYEALERDYGFSRTVIRTDYRFDDPAEAEELMRFFFGNELADTVRTNGLVRIPEWAGVWWKHFR
ncbi:class I SAM-dependent methyltransferase [Staphylospora marina]|uniref:class I SAM-dependent methyltransferase n=1 Tax=Staphylospora marina TaxID=2490858 RepID=UPI0019D2EF08|nr:class I SAM-dependent methyltransferase [Staphylospora marina]